MLLIFIISVSIVIRLAAMSLSIVLLRRMRDWRMAFLTVMLGLMAVHQILTLPGEKISWGTLPTGLASGIPGLAISIMAFLAVALLGRLIAQSKRSAEALRESDERYGLVPRGANDGLWDWDLKNNSVYFSARWKSMLGYEEIEIGNSPDEWFERVHPDEVNQVRAMISSHLEGLLPHFENEHHILHHDGTYRWVLWKGTEFPQETRFLSFAPVSSASCSCHTVYSSGTPDPLF
ncbi:PAS domain-containing protein [Candidatus Poribacteria bacterium]|nr:PAS domain-containing protein [Candidatus Poribacteria bacterium]